MRPHPGNVLRPHSQLVPVLKRVYLPGLRVGVPEEVAARIIRRARDCGVKLKTFCQMVSLVLEP